MVGAWRMAHGAWRMVRGAWWCMVHGAWCIWCIVHMVHCAWLVVCVRSFDRSPPRRSEPSTLDLSCAALTIASVRASLFCTIGTTSTISTIGSSSTISIAFVCELLKRGGACTGFLAKLSRMHARDHCSSVQLRHFIAACGCQLDGHESHDPPHESSGYVPDSWFYIKLLSEASC